MSNLTVSDLLELFDDNYDGYQAKRLTTALECVAFENMLRQLKLSYRTKIIKNKRKGVQFVIMIVEKEWVVSAANTAG